MCVLVCYLCLALELRPTVERSSQDTLGTRRSILIRGGVLILVVKMCVSVVFGGSNGILFIKVTLLSGPPVKRSSTVPYPVSLCSVHAVGGLTFLSTGCL